MGVSTSPNAGPVKEATTTLQNAAGATGNGTTLTLAPGDVVRVSTVGASVPNAVVTYEWSDDSGSTWYQAALEDLLAAAGVATRILTTAVSTSKTQLLFDAPPGATSFRARISTFVAGTVTVTAVARSRN